MTCFRRRRARWFGAVVAGLLIAACGRERTNPIDPNFAGNEALNPPTNIQAEGDIGRIRLRWNAVAAVISRATGSGGRRWRQRAMCGWAGKSPTP